jgi:hypothetical protein
MPETSPTPVGHELRDAALLPILLFAICLAATVILFHWLAWRSLRFLEYHEDTQYIAAFPANPLLSKLPNDPPDPRLEPEPSHDQLPLIDLQSVRARESSLLGPHSWGYVDPAHRFARIPLQQAMDMVVDRGLPTVLPATQPSAPPGQPPASAVHGPGGIP